MLQLLSDRGRRLHIGGRVRDLRAIKVREFDTSVREAVDCVVATSPCAGERAKRVLEFRRVAAIDERHTTSSREGRGSLRSLDLGATGVDCTNEHGAGARAGALQRPEFDEVQTALAACDPK